MKTFDSKTHVVLPKVSGPLNLALSVLWEAKKYLEESRIIAAYYAVQEAIEILAKAKEEKR